jgi:predicted nucleic-acid-binding Zn-ribbon protein
VNETVTSEAATIGAGGSEAEAVAFYFVVECAHCGYDIYSGLSVTTETHRAGDGLRAHPVIPADMASLLEFRCDHCGNTTVIEHGLHVV